MILIAEDSADKAAAMARAVGGRPVQAINWSQYLAKRTATEVVAICFDVITFPGASEAGIREEAAAQAANGRRVVMWSGNAQPNRVPENCLCLSVGPEATAALAAAAAYLRDGTAPPPTKGISWGAWKPEPPVAHLLALDVLCLGYLAIAGAGGFQNAVADTLQQDDQLGVQYLAEAAAPKNQEQIRDPRAWFEPARDAIRNSGMDIEALWRAIPDEVEALTPIRSLYNAIGDSDERPAEGWHALVDAAAYGFQKLGSRGRL